LCAKKKIFVYKLDSFVDFIGDEQLHAQECYEFSHQEFQDTHMRLRQFLYRLMISCLYCNFEAIQFIFEPLMDQECF
jgi:hypothetical protein